MAEYKRTQRVADQLQKDLASLIQFEIKDPRLGLITVSAVTVSRDLAYADVYITSLGLKDEFDQEKIVDVLNKAQGFLRSRLAGRIQLRAVPALRFHYDESIERGKGLSALIDKAIAEDAEHPANKSEEQ